MAKVATKKKVPTKAKKVKPKGKTLIKKTTKKVAKKPAKKVSFLPKGYNNITPYLIVNNAKKAIEFYKKIFNAKEVMRMEQPGGKIGHCELKIGDSKIMLADECKEMGATSPTRKDGFSMSINIYVKEVDKVVAKAVSSGGKLLRKVETMFYGDRAGTIEDPFGHKWHVSTHVEDVSMAQMKKRAAEMFGKNKGKK